MSIARYVARVCVRVCARLANDVVYRCTRAYVCLASEYRAHTGINIFITHMVFLYTHAHTIYYNNYDHVINVCLCECVRVSIKLRSRIM